MLTYISITWDCPLGDTGVFTTMVSVAMRGSDWLVLVLAFERNVY